MLAVIIAVLSNSHTQAEHTCRHTHTYTQQSLYIKATFVPGSHLSVTHVQMFVQGAASCAFS